MHLTRLFLLAEEEGENALGQKKMKDSKGILEVPARGKMVFIIFVGKVAMWDRIQIKVIWVLTEESYVL